ncbi:hypothetical protein ACI3ER_12065 [Bacillus sp. Wb]
MKVVYYGLEQEEFLYKNTLPSYSLIYFMAKTPIEKLLEKIAHAYMYIQVRRKTLKMGELIRKEEIDQIAFNTMRENRNVKIDGQYYKISYIEYHEDDDLWEVQTDYPVKIHELPREVVREARDSFVRDIERQISDLKRKEEEEILANKKKWWEFWK